MENNITTPEQSIPKQNFKTDYTIDRVEEVKRCFNDCAYFIKNYIYITTLDYGVQKFELYPYQEEFVNTVVANRKVVAMMARQMGKSTTALATILWYTIFSSNFTSAVLANKYATASELFQRFREMYEYLPDWLKPGVIEYNKTSLMLSNGSKVFCAASSTSSVRGKSINFILLDEFAYVPNQREFYASTYPTIISGVTTKVLITSTPNGFDLFHDIFVNAEKKSNMFIAFKAMWYDHPLRDKAWGEQVLKDSGQDAFNVEQLCFFAGSNSTLLNSIALSTLTPTEPLSYTEHEQYFEMPDGKSFYVINADTAEGIGSDYSTITVSKVTTLQEYSLVYAYRDKFIEPAAFAIKIAEIGTLYNTALVIVENNSIGKLTCYSLQNEIGYENLFYTRIDDGVTIESGNAKKNMVGVRTTAPVKKQGALRLKSIIESNKYTVNSKWVIEELKDFVAKGSSFAASSGKHDDLVMCLLLFSWFLTTPECTRYYNDLQF